MGDATDSCLGYIFIQPDHAGPPARQAWVHRNGRFLRYQDAGGDLVQLSTTDRRQSLAVMEDDTAERQAALREALLADRWVHVTVRG